MVVEYKKLLNWLFALSDRLGKSPRFSLPELLETAQRTTGLDDYGDDSFLEPLEILLLDLRTSSLTPLGRRLLQAQILAKLANRLHIQQFRRTHPELETRTVQRPILIAGYARTGTTLLHRLLALDPCGRAPAYWETQYPIPPVKGPDRRRRLAQRSLNLYYKLNPPFRAVHHMEVDDPEECVGFFESTFVSATYCLYAPLPTYRDWLVRRHQDHLQWVYSEYCFQLKALQRGDANRHWVLKSPVHLPCLDVIEQVFDAPIIIVTHRDPHHTLASSCSLIAHTRSPYQERVDKTAIGKELYSSWVRSIRDLFDSECHREGRVIHVAYQELIDDPIGCVRRIYAKAGRPLSEAHEQRMGNYVRENPMHTHGVHRYSLEEFGLDEEARSREWRSYDEFCARLRESERE